MKSRRKLSLQLTPLLDLLLIVFFAQYIEMQGLSAQTKIEQEKERHEYQQQVAEWIKKHEQDKFEIQGQKILLKNQLEELQRKTVQINQKDQQLTTDTQKLGQLSDDRRVLVQVLSKMFQVNAENLEQFLLKAEETGKPPLSPESGISLQNLIPRLIKLSESTEEGLIRHVLEYNELRKHCDVWNIYVNDESVIEFEAGPHKDAFNALTADDFAVRLFNVYKKLPETKGTVIMLVTYGDNPVSIRQAAIKGIPLATEKMRQDTSNRTRFEFAVLGFRPRAFKSPIESSLEKPLEKPKKENPPVINKQPSQ